MKILSNLYKLFIYTIVLNLIDLLLVFTNSLLQSLTNFVFDESLTKAIYHKLAVVECSLENKWVEFFNLRSAARKIGRAHV